MVEVLPSASPRAAALGRKLNFAIAASTERFSPALTLTVPLMMRDTVLAETPASRATMRKVADWRGRGPLLPGIGTGIFDLTPHPLGVASERVPGPRASCRESPARA